jgi:hypothetical protein
MAAPQPGLPDVERDGGPSASTSRRLRFAMVRLAQARPSRSAP